MNITLTPSLALLISVMVLSLPAASLLAQEDAPEVNQAPTEGAKLTPLAAPMEIQRMPRLTVKVEGLIPSTGKVEVSLFNSAETFMTKPFLQDSGTPDENGAMQVTFLNVFEGEYGLVVVHDENDNDLYDAGFLGFGAEAVAYSNDASAWLGRPSWEAVSFEVQEDLEVTIHVD